ncbi:hypothetical protein VNI00_001424 [Paramarasmius palmivorus]|uniref:Uncharacterized protein n=1 Tax=Paramarasmius palmivorus TaxID=297713 RepID=A0AAW0E2Y2_9AGAR
MSSSSSTSGPPYYILFTQSSSSLGHPTIQYHYADDSPLSLLPQLPDEHVIILDYVPASPQSPPTVVSTSRSLAVTGLRVEEAQGAAALEEKHNDRMYIIETTASVDKSSRNDVQQPHAILEEFKQRNAVLRRALTFNGNPTVNTSPRSPLKPYDSPQSPMH